jgi:hypothetical protein
MKAEANNTPESAATPVATSAVSWRTRLFKPVLYAGALVVAGTLTTASWWWSCGWQGCPTPTQLRAWKPTEGGALLARDSAFVSALSPVNRTNVPLSRVPAQVQAAFIAVEDRRFHAHHGVDWYGVGRATVANITAGSVREGASTITMQLARTVFLGNRATERTFGRKLLEWRYATLLEGSLSKQDILEQGGAEPLLAFAHGPPSWLSKQCTEMLGLLNVPLGDPDSAPTLLPPPPAITQKGVQSTEQEGGSARFATARGEGGTARGAMLGRPSSPGRGPLSPKSLTARQRFYAERALASSRSSGGAPKMKYHFFSFQIHHLTGYTGFT